MVFILWIDDLLKLISPLGIPGLLIYLGGCPSRSMSYRSFDAVEASSPF